jgi:hypothetical protein
VTEVIHFSDFSAPGSDGGSLCRFSRLILNLGDTFSCGAYYRGKNVSREGIFELCVTYFFSPGDKNILHGGAIIFFSPR